MRMQANKNVVALESEQKAPQAGRLLSPILSPPSTIISSPNTSLTDLMSERMFLKTIKYSTSDPAGHINFVTDFNLSTNETFATWSNYFIGRKFDLEVTFDVNSHFQQVGLLAIMERDPAPWHDTSTITTQALFEYPHQLITLGHNGTYTWTMSYPYPIGYITNNDIKGKLLTLVNVEAMRVAAGVEPIASVTVYIRLVNITGVARIRKD